MSVGRCGFVVHFCVCFVPHLISLGKFSNIRGVYIYVTPSVIAPCRIRLLLGME